MISALRKVFGRTPKADAPQAVAAPSASETPPPLDLSRHSTYFACAEKTALKAPALFLSFDCDTDWDIERVGPLYDFLTKLGIKATFAVPGVQLQKGAKEYRAVADRGGEFMNHGFAPHAEWQGDRYVSVTWYHEMTREAVEADMRAAHAKAEEIIGRAPRGFRAPHFGHFQKPEQLALVRGIAHDLGYAYCSTTIPQAGLENGPAFRADGVVELPCFGSARNPTTLLDTWTYLTDRRDYALGDDYADLFIDTVDTLIAAGKPALFTWYGDPSHVMGQRPFERAMEHIAKRGVPSLSGSEAAALAG